jgi:hypothetical protein
MGLFSSSSKSSSATNAATDQSNVVGGSKAQVGTLNLGERATYQESGAFSNLGTIKGGFAEAKFTAGANSSITIGETGVAETFASTIKDLFAAKNEAPAPTAAAPSWGNLSGLDYGNGSQTSAFTLPDWLKSPWVLGGVAAALLGVLVLLRRK